MTSFHPAVVVAKEFEGIADYYTAKASAKVTPAARLVSPSVVPISAPLTSIVCAVPANTTAGDEASTCRFAGSVSSHVLSKPPAAMLPSALAGYRVGLGLVPVVASSSAAAPLLPLSWPAVDVDVAVALVTGTGATASDPTADKFTKQFPTTTARAAAHRSFAPLMLDEQQQHAASTAGLTVVVVSRRGWLTGQSVNGVVVFALVWIAVAPSVDGSSFAWVLEAMTRRLASAANTAVKASAAGTAPAATPAANKRPLCPQDQQCTKMMQALHMRMFVHSCRQPQPCMQRRDPKHAQDYLHVGPLAQEAQQQAAADESAEQQAAADAAAEDARKAFDAGRRVWYDVSDPWVIRPRRRAKASGSNTAPRPPRDAANATSTATTQATTFKRAFSSDDDDDEDAAVRRSSTSVTLNSTNSASLSTAAADDVISVMEVRVSLRCPLSFAIMRHPVKGRRCTHDQCFDLTSHLVSAARRAAWNCPVCDNAAYPLDLVPSKVLEDALQQLDAAKLSLGVDAILLTPPATWRFVTPSTDDASDASDEEYDGPLRRRQPAVAVELSISQTAGSTGSLPAR